jgi:beta-glucanase (GH16 family)
VAECDSGIVLPTASSYRSNENSITQTLTHMGYVMKKLIWLVLSMVLVSATAVLALPKVVTDTLKMGLVWSDEFNGTSLDTVNNWSYDTGMVYNQEQESYKRACVEVSDGSLKIWSKQNLYGVNYPSGRIDTHDKKIFTYGYFEAAIKGPVGTGGKNGPALWSAVWLLGNSINHGTAWPTCGEMELYEQRTGPQNESGNCSPAAPGDDAFIGTCHYGNGNGGPVYNSCQHNYPKALTDRFHTFGILWDTTSVHYYFDDTLFWGPNFPTGCGAPSILQASNQVAFSSPFYWIINVAVGGTYQGQNIDNTIFPTHLDIDYVRVYQRGITSAVNSDFRFHAPKSSELLLMNPSTAQLKIYDLKGQLIADYTNRVRQMRAGDNIMKTLPSMLSRGAYIMRLIDNGNSFSQNLVSMK